MIKTRMKTMKNDGKNGEFIDDDGDMGHMLFGFDEGTTGFYNNSQVKSDTDCNNASVGGGGGSSSNSGLYFRWAPESIKMMLTMRFDMDREFSQRLRQKKDLWNEIAAEMTRVGGYSITGEICDLKFRNMLQTYKKNRLKEERGLQELIIWEYYTMFKEAAVRSNECSGDQVIPSLLCESVCTEDVVAQQAMRVGEENECKPVISNKKTPIIRRSTRKRRASSHSVTDNSSVEPEQVAAERSSMEMEVKNTPLHQQQSQQQQRQHYSLPAAPSMSLEPHETSANATDNKSLSMRFMPPSPPAWLTASELSECEVFGHSVGAQLSNVRDSYTRSLLKLKIQELIFLARTGKLTADKYTSSYD